MNCIDWWFFTKGILKDILEAFTTYKDVIAGLASGFTALFAFQAVKSYKEQINYQANKESSEEVMLSLIALRQAIDLAGRVPKRGPEDALENTLIKFHNSIAEALTRYTRDCSKFKFRTRIDLYNDYPV